MDKIKKIMVSMRLYGLMWTLVKLVGRTGNTKLKVFFPRLWFKSKKKNVSLIGCGQFGFSSISFHLYGTGNNSFLECYDPDQSAVSKAESFWGYLPSTPDHIFNNSDCEYVYIASNHFSHTEYAIQSLAKGKHTFIEKPISVNRLQLESLCDASEKSVGNVYVGYNRPFSRAIRRLSPMLNDTKEAISMTCHITGHFLPEDHWYRNKQEGTRVCGNMGHWIDLSIYLMKRRGQIPNKFNISIAYASLSNTDDNFVVSYSTDCSDIVSICMTSRSEPFEGINETININSGDTIAKIDDFRTLQTWKGSTYSKKRFSKKDIGHRKSISQPFNSQYKRDFKEIIISSLLMIRIKEMVEEGTRQAEYSLVDDPIFQKYVSGK